MKIARNQWLVKYIITLKRLGVSVTLTLVLAVAAFAGEMSAPPCAPPDPGEMNAPPCAAAPTADDPALPGQTDTPPAADSVVVSAVVEAALNLLLIF